MKEAAEQVIQFRSHPLEARGARSYALPIKLYVLEHTFFGFRRLPLYIKGEIDFYLL
ncbi:hypothetical protein KSX_32300 [Ktedonospora formicarum]|uniref:Uncharacterized protein n=1 Tax=Ktedonospora formicarum TaxID=2778364 RepID=A0A8J3I2J3_9CHLR|nr:hypothetical protein KSX_32300 [Ktedonospora formicarum]